MAGGCERSAHASLCTSVTNVKGGQRDGLVGVNVRPDEVGSKTGTGLVARVGVTLMVSSLPLWLVLPVLPFLPISGATKATIAAMTVVIAELAFWGGAALAGPTAVRRLRSWWQGR